MSSAATVWIPLAVSAATQAAATAPGESLRRMVSAPHCGHVRCPVDRLRPPWGGFQRSLLPVAQLGLLAHVVEQVAAHSSPLSSPVNRLGQPPGGFWSVTVSAYS